MKRKICIMILMIFIIAGGTNVVFALSEDEEAEYVELVNKFFYATTEEASKNLKDEEAKELIDYHNKKANTNEHNEDFVDTAVFNAENLVQTRIAGGSYVDHAKWDELRKEASKLYTETQNRENKKGKEAELKKYAQKLQNKIEEMKKYSAKETLEYNNSEIPGWNDYANKILKKLGEEEKNIHENQVDNEGKVSTPGESVSNKIYKWPTAGTATGKTEDATLEDMIKDGDNFIKAGTQDKISQDDLKSLSGSLYNIVLEIGVGLSVIIGLVLGIKFMLAGVEEKAEVKKMIWIYVVGCIVTFGSFGIWKLVVTILEEV